MVGIPLQLVSDSYLRQVLCQVLFYFIVSVCMLQTRLLDFIQLVAAEIPILQN